MRNTDGCVHTFFHFIDKIDRIDPVNSCKKKEKQKKAETFTEPRKQQLYRQIFFLIFI